MMIQNISRIDNWLQPNGKFWCCAVLGTLFLGGGNLARAQLVYVDGQDDFSPASQNLFCSAGGALSSCLLNNTAVNGDNLWGFVEAGAPSGGVASNYESNTENSPELRMRVAAPNGNFDAYAVFWADVNVQFLIRAGLTSNPGGNMLFGRTNANGATPGVFAASALWATPPEDNPNATTDDDDNDDTNILNPLTGDNPFVDHVPAAGGGLRMYLAPLGMVTASGGGFDVFIDDGPSTNDQNRARFEGVAYVATGTDVTLEATIDRATGNLTINNTTGSLLNIGRYTITSPQGALDSTQWDSITTGGNPTITETNPWTTSAPTTPAASVTALTEAESPAANGAQFVATTGAFNLGNVWVKSPFQDVLVSLELVGGSKVQLLPTYAGDAVDIGDLDGDNDVDVSDYTRLVQNMHVPQAAGLTRVQYYKNGDMTGNNVVNRDDFIAFRNAFFAANPGSGAAEWNAMVTSIGVPEPASLALVALAGGLILSVSRRRSCIGKATTPIVSLIITALFAGASQAEDVTGWQVYNTTNPSATLTGADTNDPVFGNNTVDAIDNAGIWGSTSNIHLEPSEEAVLRGRVQILGHSGAGREFRWGMWKKVVQPTNPNTNLTAGWLGYMALNGAGGGTGRLEAKNPDSDFQSALFISDQGGQSTRTCCSGPQPAAGNPLLDGSVNGPNQAGTEGTPPNIPRYFLLAEANVTGNAGFANNLWYTFEIRVGRYGEDEATVSASLVSDATVANGDFNNNGTVDAADYVLWRNGGPLANEGGITTGMNTPEDFNTWRANFGAIGTVPYRFNIGGGLDVNGQPPLNPGATTYTDHVTFDFDRVGLLFGGALDADQATFQDVTIAKNTIDTLDLRINPATGAASIRNNLAASFDMAYYEITSASGALEFDNWASLDKATGGTPATNDYGVGWDEAGGSSDNILAESNLTSSELLTQNESIPLGNIFKTAGARDLRFFIGLTNGSVVRGTVTYSAAGLGSAVPEPAAIGLLIAGALGLGLIRRRPME